MAYHPTPTDEQCAAADLIVRGEGTEAEKVLALRELGVFTSRRILERMGHGLYQPMFASSVLNDVVQYAAWGITCDDVINVTEKFLTAVQANR